MWPRRNLGLRSVRVLTRKGTARRNVTGLAALFLIAGIGPAAAQESIDLSEAIQRALERNRELVRSALATGSSELRVTDARAEFQLRVRPEVTADVFGSDSFVGYGLLTSKKLTQGTELSLTGRVARLTNEFDEPDDMELHRGSVRVEIRQPLLRNFGSLVHREPMVQANSDLQRARRRFELQRTDLVLEVVRTYEEILRLEQRVRADNDSFERMDALYEVTEAKAAHGRTTRVDTLRVSLLRGEALARLETSQERLESTRQDFAELLGQPPDTVFELTQPALLDIDVPGPEEAVRTALANRLDYAQVLQDAEDSGRRLRIARRRFLPDLVLVAGHEWFGEDPSRSRAIQLDDNRWFVGLAAGTDLNLTRDRIAVGQAELNQSAVQQTVEIVELSIARQVQQQLLAYRRAQGELKISERNQELAENRLKVARRFFEMGRGDNFSVTDAEEAFLQSENRWLSSRAEASISGYRLFRALGNLLPAPQDLKPRSR